MASDLPAKEEPTQPTGLDRRAVERVLARAAELQGLGSGERDEDAIGEEKLLEIAKEAGLSITSVRQALAEERTHLQNDSDADSRWLVRDAGPSTISASRVITGEPKAMVASLETWMEHDECLIVQRRFADRIVWEARKDWVGAIRRGLKIGGREYHLARASQIAATVVPVDEHRSLVRLDADLGAARTGLMRASAAVGATGVVASGTVVTGAAVIAHIPFILIFGFAAAPIALAGAGAYALLRRQHAFSARMLLALEQVLDRLEYGDVRRPKNIIDALTMPRALYR